MTEAAIIYRWLIDGAEAAAYHPFDVHVLACVLALGIAEAETSGLPLSESTGLTSAALNDLMRPVFPQAVPVLERLGGSRPLRFPEDERSLRELLMRFVTQQTPFGLRLAALFARRAMRPNHLWQDLGLQNRGELSQLMGRHFTTLAARNVRDMKWKKFLYRMICRDEGFRLCTAPSCAECNDFVVCFGDESGESIFARNRRASELYENSSLTRDTSLTRNTIGVVDRATNGPQQQTAIVLA